MPTFFKKGPKKKGSWHLEIQSTWTGYPSNHGHNLNPTTSWLESYRIPAWVLHPKIGWYENLPETLRAKTHGFLQCFSSNHSIDHDKRMFPPFCQAPLLESDAPLGRSHYIYITCCFPPATSNLPECHGNMSESHLLGESQIYHKITSHVLSGDLHQCIPT